MSRENKNLFQKDEIWIKKIQLNDLNIEKRRKRRYNGQNVIL